METGKVISIATKEIPHMKVILAGWYSFLKDSFDKKSITSEEFKEYLHANVVYNLDKDQIELLLAAREEVLLDFRKSLSE